MSTPTPRRRRSPPSRRPSVLEQQWPFVRDVGATLIGAFILVEQTIFTAKAQTVLVVAGLALLGVPASGVAQRILARYLDAENK